MADNKKDKGAPEGVRYITVPVGENVDDATVEALIRELAPPVAGVVGNYADIQRAGAAIVAGDAKDLASGVEVPPGEDMKQQIATAKAVEDAVEASKTGNPSSVGDSHTGASIPGGTYNVKGTK